MSDLNPYEESLAVDLAKANARIEQFSATCEQVEQKLKDLGEWRNNLVENLAETEAKLAKAVKCLRWYADHCTPKYAGEVLAELEGKE